MSLISASGFSPSCSEILKGFVGIGPLYGLSWNPFIHFFSCSPANVLSWYDSLNSRTSMVRFLGIVASPACSTCVSKILTLVYLFRIPSHCLSSVGWRAPFVDAAPILGASSLWPNALPIHIGVSNQTHSDSCSFNCSHTCSRRIGIWNSIGILLLSWMLARMVSSRCSSYTLSGKPT